MNSKDIKLKKEFSYPNNLNSLFHCICALNVFKSAILASSEN